MKILIDIGHPAHVHYFKNFVSIMTSRGHDFLVIAKDRNVTHELLVAYNIDFTARKDYPKNILGKLINIPATDFFVIRKSLKFKPDILLGFSGTHVSHAGWLLGIPSIILDDTDHAYLAHLSYKYFSTTIITPSCFNKDFGRKHIRFDSYMELSYLHPKYFKPKSEVLSTLGLKKREKFVLIQFVSWAASHDIGQSGLDYETKIQLVKEMEKYAKVFISSENDIPQRLRKFKINIPSHRMHDVLSYATLYIGEGATMASECAVLGTPAIYINSLDVSYCSEQEKRYGLVHCFRNSGGVIKMALKLLRKINLKETYREKCCKMLEEKLDTTAFLVSFIENYPHSINYTNLNQQKN